MVYALVPLIMGWLLLKQRTLTGDDPPRRSPLPTWVRLVLRIQAAIMLPLGIGLFLFPVAVAPIWPWGLTALTGRAIGAWLTSIGVIAVHAAHENDWTRLRSFAASYAMLAVMQLMALLRFGSEIEGGAGRLALSSVSAEHRGGGALPLVAESGVVMSCCGRRAGNDTFPEGG